MRFGPVPIAQALGATAVHSVRLPDGVLRKGTVIGAPEIARLAAAEIAVITVVRLDPGDVDEDVAAQRLADALAGSGVRVERAFTGRANLFAEQAGVLVVDVAAIDRVNAIDEAVTFATLPAFRAVEEGEMIGTVKIIPFAVPDAMVDAALAAAGGAVLRVAPYHPMKVGVVSTLLPGLKPSVVRKTVAVLQGRLGPAGASIVADIETPHETGALADALVSLAAGPAELIVVFGASAITDRRDVIPAALEQAGGTVTHFGMPVDPGNLLLLGTLAGRPFLGAPGCARSPRENGFDWVLQRLLAGLPVSREAIMRMGVGGLLMEIVQRGHPRTHPPQEDTP